MFLIFRGNSDSFIPYFNLMRLSVSAYSASDGFTFIRIFAGIGNEVVKNITQYIFIGFHFEILKFMMAYQLLVFL